MLPMKNLKRIRARVRNGILTYSSSLNIKYLYFIFYINKHGNWKYSIVFKFK